MSKRCYYEVLSVERSVNEDELKQKAIANVEQNGSQGD